MSGVKAWIVVIVLVLLAIACIGNTYHMVVLDRHVQQLCR